MEFSHVPVLLNETIDGLRVKPEGIYIDCTLGGGGHSLEIIKRLSTGRLIGIDQDDAAIAAAKLKLAPYMDKGEFVRANFEELPRVLKGMEIGEADGILMDIGVSSHQFDDAQRGFSYRNEAPLDMRMDRRNALTAYRVVNEYSKEELERILRDYGEEKMASKIAANICRERQNSPIETTLELTELVKSSMPIKMRSEKGHPAKRTFQAIRIEVNRELEVLESSLDMMIDLLAPGGRLAVITFHSLEDRIVKNAFKKAQNPCECPPSFPVCTCKKSPRGKVVGRKPIVAGEAELELNPRAKSAKLRIFEKF